MSQRSIANRILCADAYTVSSFEVVSRAMRERAAYHLVFRRFEAPRGLEDLSPGKLVFHGLTRILRSLLARPLERAEIDEAEAVLRTFHVGGRPYPLDRPMWERVAELGYFPIRVYARRDGAIVNVGEPVVQVVSEPDFGEVAAHFESKLVQVWAPSARATVMRRWLEYNERLVRETTDACDPAEVRELAAYQTSDFGDRAGSCPEESEVLGLAHLTSHATTDTLAAARAAHAASGGRFTGASIRALAHRVVLGHAGEADAFRTLAEVAGGEGGISSHVVDCHDFERAVTEHMIPLARRAAERGAAIYARPDSGDGLERIRFILDAARAAGLARTNGRGLVEMTALHFIYADGLTFEAIRHGLNEPLARAGYAVPRCGCYGVGGFLRDCIRRDMLGAALKLCAVGPELRPVAKVAPGGKSSIPGLVRVVPSAAGGPTVFPADAAADFGELRLLYDRGRFTEDFAEGEDFLNVRRRVLEDWDAFVPSAEPLAPALLAMRETLRGGSGAA